MEKRRRNGLLFLLGVAVGAAAGYYANSDEGRKVRRETGDRLNEFGNEMSTSAKEQMNQLSENMNRAVGRSRHYVDDVSATLKNRINSLAKASEEKTNREMDKAKRKIRKGIRRLEEILEKEIA